MILPTTKIENKFTRQGKIIIGIDEAGRGPLAGPVVAAAVFVFPQMLKKNFPERKLIRDSKTLSEIQREKVFEFIKSRDEILFGIGEASHKIIDKINILNAALQAMKLALEDLRARLNKEILKGELCVLIDGNRKIPEIKYEQHVFPGGDQSIFSIALASICAKVHRDTIMEKYHKKYPHYGFDQHKGYGTPHHLLQIKKHGPCRIHRRFFSPMKELFNLT